MKYREVRSIVESAVEGGGEDSDQELWRTAIDAHKGHVAHACRRLLALRDEGVLEASSRDLLPSYLHLLINRLLSTPDIEIELALYYLPCHYHAVMGRASAHATDIDMARSAADRENTATRD